MLAPFLDSFLNIGIYPFTARLLLHVKGKSTKCADSTAMANKMKGMNTTKPKSILIAFSARGLQPT